MPSGNQTFAGWAGDREMLDRFIGERGRRLRIEALVSQNLVVGNRALAEELADRVEVCAVSKGELLISQGAGDNDIYFILSGSFDVIVNGQKVAILGPTEHVGEMAAVQPPQKRSASVVATDNAIVARLSAEAFTDLGNRYPQMFGSSRKSLRAVCWRVTPFSGNPTPPEGGARLTGRLKGLAGLFRRCQRPHRLFLPRRR
jgi:CRP-like cAMP-binding protein